MYFEVTYIGADWASGCWVVVELGKDIVNIDTEPTLLNVWHEHRDASAILIDVPIGLPIQGPRHCDQEASDYLGLRGNTVFPVPSRTAIEARGYTNAAKANKDANCGGLGAQSWGIISQIKEVDVFLDALEEARDRVYESHPEVCFSKLAGDDILPKKTTSDGFERRIEILHQMDPQATDEICAFIDKRKDGNAEWHHRIQSGRIDDVLDASVLAFTAKQLQLASREKMNSYPSFSSGETKTDEKNLPMEIVYPDTSP